MLRLALSFELTRLLRSRAIAIAIAAYLAAGALAVALGQAHVETWQAAIAAGEAAQADSVAEARGFFDRGESGPSDKPWVDLSQAGWQDRYAGTRLARLPGPLAGVAVGAVDPAPAVFHVHLRADPLAAGGYRIEHPELAAGSVDLVFVLSVLTPLLIGVLGLGIGGQEREERIDRLVLIQAGAVWRWLVARTLAVSLLAAATATLLCVSAGLVGGADLTQILSLASLACLYSLLWGGLLLAANAGAPSVRRSAFGFGLLWTVLCILLPTLAAEVGLGRVQDDFAANETTEAREQLYETYEHEPAALVDQVYVRFPELTELPVAKMAELPSQARRHVYDAVRLDALLERHAARSAQERRAVALAETAALTSPPLALTLALERLSGVGPEAAAAYRSALVREVERRVRWALLQVWSDTPLDRHSFETVLEQRSPPVLWQPQLLLGPSLVLGAWLLSAWLLALLALWRAERQLGLR